MVFEVVILALAAWLSFAKSSLQAALCLLILSTALGCWPLLIPTGLLLTTSLLIPRPNPRHQRRRFRVSKLIYVCLFFALGYFFAQQVWLFNPTVLASAEAVAELRLEQLILPFSFFVFVSFLLLTRKYVD